MSHPIAIVGPSGAGKDTIVAAIIERYVGQYRKFVSTTTRPARPGEVDGVDYHFISPETYAQWQAEDRFILSIDFAGASYGTLRSEIEAGAPTLLMVVVESVALEMREIAGAKILVIDVPEHIVAERMRARGDSEEQIEIRLAADHPRRKLMLSTADAIVVNDDLETAITDTQRLIQDLSHTA
jgi:guanylate kinase